MRNEEFQSPLTNSSFLIFNSSLSKASRLQPFGVGPPPLFAGGLRAGIFLVICLSMKQTMTFSTLLYPAGLGKRLPA